MIWHYHDDDVAGADAAIELTVEGITEKVKSADLKHYRVDDFHGNSYDTWRRMGSPVAPGRKQYEELEAASNLALVGDPDSVAIDQGVTKLSFRLPRQGVSLVVLQYK